MINGYVTYDELKTITGYTDDTLRRLLIDGLCYHELSFSVETDRRFKKALNEHLFDLKQVEAWLKVHIF